MSARPGLCGGHWATGVPTAIASYSSGKRNGLIRAVAQAHARLPFAGPRFATTRGTLPHRTVGLHRTVYGEITFSCLPVPPMT